MKRFTYGWIIALFLLLEVLPIQAQEKTEKSVVKVNVAYYQQNEDLPIIKASAKTKKGKKFEPREGVEISLYFNEESTQGFMGRLKTNNKGEVSLVLPDRLKDSWASTPVVKFLATVTGNEQFEDASAEIEITKAKIEVTVEEKDSVRMIYAKVLALQDSSWVEVPETEIKIVVKRLLSDIKVGEEDSYTTDEKGEASAEFNLTIPGDSKGNIFVGAKIEDHELYGNLMASKQVKWGTPLQPDHSFAERTLWATRDKTPLWLLIFPNLIITTVWGIIFYLFFQISRIVKLGKTNTNV